MDRKENDYPYDTSVGQPTFNRYNKPLPVPLQESPYAVNNRDVNFSRKREPTSPIRTRREIGNVNASNESKRHKKSNSRGHINQHHVEPVAQLHNASDNRQSRFREESMRDKPSEKPPSMFLRILPGASHVNPSVDQLMEDYYHEQSQRPPLMATSRSASRATQVSGLTHHPNNSISSNTTLAVSTQSRDSGLFKFGRHIASSINPVNIWQKVTRSRDSREIDAADYDTEFVERQLRAEQAYATLKTEGKFGTSKLRSRSVDFNSLAPDYNNAIKPSENQRDSGIDMSNDWHSPARDGYLRAPSLSPQRVSAMPGSRSVSKKFHLRTPSYQDLKRIASDINLHRRTASESASNLLAQPSPQPAKLFESRPKTPAAHSNKKQAKLTKKASNLEAKLASVRKELNQFPRQDLLPEPKLEARPKSSALLRKRFAPLPTLPSESLLQPEEEAPRPMTSLGRFEAMLDLSSSPAKDHLYSVEVIEAKQVQFSKVETGPEPISIFESSSAESSPNGPLLKAFIKPKKLTKSPNKVESAISPEKLSSPKKPSPKRIRPKANTGSPTRLRGSVSSPVLVPNETTDDFIPRNDNRSSLDTVQEESFVAMSFKVALNSPPAIPTAFATPANPRGYTLRQPPTISPIKNIAPNISARRAEIVEQSPSVMESPGPHTNFSRPSSPRKGTKPLEVVSPIQENTSPHSPVVASPAIPRLAPAREHWEWPEDIF